jgi:PIN domain nuclease of toxin-antitoxin system
MRLLLDSNAVYWRLVDAPRLSESIQQLIDDPSNEVVASAASVWELEIKRAKGKLTLPGSVLQGLALMRIAAISIDAEDADAAAKLPRHHADPFDRMLIAQAVRRGLAIVTSDGKFQAYGVAVLPP